MNKLSFIISVFHTILGTSCRNQSVTMKRIFGRAGKEKEDEAEELSLDILLAHKEDIITKVGILHYLNYTYIIIYCIFQLKNEYKTFLIRKMAIEKDLVLVEKQELELR